METLDDKMRRWLRGDVQAIAFCDAFSRIVHLWDDLIDRDRTPADDEIHAAFYSALVSLPRNPFYRANFEFLNSLIVNAINQWHAANWLEKHGEGHEKLVAFVIRSSYADLTTHCAHLIGGPEWAKQVAVEVRQSTHGEGLEKYAAALANEPRLREE